MAGDGKLTQTVKNMIEDMGLTSNIKLLGFVNQPELIFPALDVFILPSRNEGLGTVMLEAIAAGTVVVASNVGGISEVILDRQTGRLIEPSNTGAFVDAAVQLLEDAEQRETLAESAQRHVEREFDLKNMTRKTLELYENLSELSGE